MLNRPTDPEWAIQYRAKSWLSSWLSSMRHTQKVVHLVAAETGKAAVVVNPRRLLPQHPLRRRYQVAVAVVMEVDLAMVHPVHLEEGSVAEQKAVEAKVEEDLAGLD